MDAKKTLIGLTLTVIFIFALGAIAMASDIAFYVGRIQLAVYTQGLMDSDVEKIINDTGALFNDIKQFDDDKLDEFGEWVDANTGDDELDIIWLNGNTPSVLYPLENTAPDGSRAEEWLDDGNMIINVAEWFTYCTHETGVRINNSEAGAANILDLPQNIIVGADGIQMTVTDTGKKFMPSLGDQVGTNRPVNIDAIAEPWEAAAIFAEAGDLADPIVLHNKDTDGYLAIVNQGWAANAFDRGAACAEFIKNWVAAEKELLAVEPAGKLSTTWGRENTRY